MKYFAIDKFHQIYKLLFVECFDLFETTRNMTIDRILKFRLETKNIKT